GNPDGACLGNPVRSGDQRGRRLHQLAAQQGRPRAGADPDGARGRLHDPGRGQGGVVTTSRPASLRREILIWYSLVLVVALSLFATAAYFLLQRAVIRAEQQSLSQAASAVEQFAVPAGIPRLETEEEFATIETPAGERIRAFRR